MHPKEIHCIIPFLKEKYISRAEFFTISKSSYSEECGMNFQGITADKLMEFLSYICKSRLHKVDGSSIAKGRIIYLAGDTIGDRTCYLLTAAVKEYEGLTQLVLRANSNNKSGLNGFLNEIMDNMSHFVAASKAREIGIIKKEQAINIIDSVGEMPGFSVRDNSASVNFRRGKKEESEKEEKEKKRKSESEKKELELKKERLKEEEVKRKPKAGSFSKERLFAAAVILGIMAAVYFVYMPDSNTGPTNVTKPESTPHMVYIEVKGSQFNPAELRIVKGTPVRWTNLDSAVHIIKGDDFESSPLNKREMWSYRDCRITP